VTAANFFIDAMFSDASRRCRNQLSAVMKASTDDGRALVAAVPWAAGHCGGTEGGRGAAGDTTIRDVRPIIHHLRPALRPTHSRANYRPPPFTDSMPQRPASA